MRNFQRASHQKWSRWSNCWQLKLGKENWRYQTKVRLDNKGDLWCWYRAYCELFSRSYCDLWVDGFWWNLVQHNLTKAIKKFFNAISWRCNYSLFRLLPKDETDRDRRSWGKTSHHRSKCQDRDESCKRTHFRDSWCLFLWFSLPNHLDISRLNCQYLECQ